MENKINLKINIKYLKNLKIDLYQQVWDLTAQVPPGRVTTYGAIARALGDIRASRAVGLIEHVNPYAPQVPCHRVVYSDGGLGGFGAPEGVSKKIELLESEGVRVKDGKIVKFNEILFEDFILPKKSPLERLRQEQWALRTKISLKDQKPSNQLHTIAGLDVSYSGEEAFGAVVVMDLDSLHVLETQTSSIRTRFPYIPTYLSYHELPIAIELLEKLTINPDILLFDGNGVLHPAGVGLASHAGVIFETPTMGIAKKLLCGELRSLKFDNEVEEVFEVILNDHRIGYGFKPKTAKNRLVYVSPGNNISFVTSLQLALKLCKTRIPEPIRIAHTLALASRNEKSQEK